MRLLLVNYEYPPLGGGAGNATANLAKELARQGNEVVVLTSAFQDLPRRETESGFTIRRTPVLRRRADRSSFLEKLLFMVCASADGISLVRRWRPEVVITFFGVPGGPVGMALKIIYGIPYLVSLRGGDVPGFPYPGLAFFHRLIGFVIRFVWRQASGVIANSRGLQRLAQKATPDVPIQVIPNGVDIELFSPTLAKPAADKIRVLFTGRVVYQKGLDVVLRALTQAAAPVELEVVGDGDDRPALEKMAAELGLRDRVRFAGWAPRTDLPAHYRAADIFVLASRAEGMPNVVLEAMACGLPVIATQVAGNEELVQEGVSGLMIPPEDVPALAHALEKLAADEALRRQMGEAGRRRVNDEFTWQQIARQYLEVCKSVLETRR